jgi:hypothetical protein
MAKGFIYVVKKLTRDYVQRKFCAVPTFWGERLYFGPCKKPMRPRMQAGDYVFGISDSKLTPRRIVFIAQIEERIRFAEAYERFPELRGPEGPIHVKPIPGAGSFPASEYQHIRGSMHEDGWEDDLGTRDLDAFFVCTQRNGGLGDWLGRHGPEIDPDILSFLQTCGLHGTSVPPNTRNEDATLKYPVAYKSPHTGNFSWRGLHLETDQAEQLLKRCDARMAANKENLDLDRVVTPERRPSSTTGRPSGQPPVKCR